MIGADKWVITCNWKFPAENFRGDLYHVQWEPSLGDRDGVQLGGAGTGIVGDTHWSTIREEFSSRLPELFRRMGMKAAGGRITSSSRPSSL
jgi:hypothetical protein